MRLPQLTLQLPLAPLPLLQPPPQHLHLHLVRIHRFLLPQVRLQETRLAQLRTGQPLPHPLAQESQHIVDFVQPREPPLLGLTDPHLLQQTAHPRLELEGHLLHLQPQHVLAQVVSRALVRRLHYRLAVVDRLQGSRPEQLGPVLGAVQEPSRTDVVLSRKGLEWLVEKGGVGQLLAGLAQDTLVALEVQLCHKTRFLDVAGCDSLLALRTSSLHNKWQYSASYQTIIAIIQIILKIIEYSSVHSEYPHLSKYSHTIHKLSQGRQSITFLISQTKQLHKSPQNLHPTAINYPFLLFQLAPCATISQLLVTFEQSQGSEWLYEMLKSDRIVIGEVEMTMIMQNQPPNPQMVLPCLLSAQTTSIAVTVFLLACSVQVTASLTIPSRNPLRTCLESSQMKEEILLTPPLLASLRIAGLVMPSIEARACRFWAVLLVPTFPFPPTPFPPFPWPAILIVKSVILPPFLCPTQIRQNPTVLILNSDWLLQHQSDQYQTPTHSLFHPYTLHMLFNNQSNRYIILYHIYFIFCNTMFKLSLAQTSLTDTTFHSNILLFDCFLIILPSNSKIIALLCRPIYRLFSSNQSISSKNISQL